MGTVRTDEFRKDAVRIARSSKDQKTVWGIILPEDGLSRQQIADDPLAIRRLPSIAVRLGVGISTLNK